MLFRSDKGGTTSLEPRAVRSVLSEEVTRGAAGETPRSARGDQLKGTTVGALGNDSKNLACKRVKVNICNVNVTGPRVIAQRFKCAAKCSNVESHELQECQSFKDASLAKRWKIVKRYDRCFLCLGSGHCAEDCVVEKDRRHGDCVGDHASYSHSQHYRSVL